MGQAVIILDGIDFMFKESELDKITNLHHSGMWMGDIAKEMKRNGYEVLLALVHQHIKGKLKKPIAFRRK